MLSTEISLLKRGDASQGLQNPEKSNTHMFKICTPDRRQARPRYMLLHIYGRTLAHIRNKKELSATRTKKRSWMVIQHVPSNKNLDFPWRAPAFQDSPGMVFPGGAAASPRPPRSDFQDLILGFLYFVVGLWEVAPGFSYEIACGMQ